MGPRVPVGNAAWETCEAAAERDGRPPAGYSLQIVTTARDGRRVARGADPVVHALETGALSACAVFDPSSSHPKWHMRCTFVPATGAALTSAPTAMVRTHAATHTGRRSYDSNDETAGCLDGHPGSDRMAGRVFKSQS